MTFLVCFLISAIVGRFSLVLLAVTSILGAAAAVLINLEYGVLFDENGSTRSTPVFLMFLGSAIAGSVGQTLGIDPKQRRSDDIFED